MRTKRISSVDVTVNNGKYKPFIVVTVHKRGAHDTKYIENKTYHCFDWNNSTERRERFLTRAQKMQAAFYNRGLTEDVTNE